MFLAKKTRKHVFHQMFFCARNAHVAYEPSNFELLKSNLIDQNVYFLDKISPVFITNTSMFSKNIEQNN